MSVKLVFYCILSAIIAAGATFAITYQALHKPEQFILCQQEIQARYDVENLAEPGTVMTAKQVTGYIGFVTIAGKQSVYSCSIAGGKVERLVVDDSNPLLRAFAQGEKLGE